MSTHIRSSISATRGVPMWDSVYLQQEEHSCGKTLYLQQEERTCGILYICNKRSTHVAFSISATRGTLM